MKRLIKKVFYTPIGVYLCRIIRWFYRPSEDRAAWMKFKGEFSVQSENGPGFRLYNNAFIFETMIFWRGLEMYSWERTTRKVWNKLAQKSNVVLDIGANSGIFSVLAGAYNPAATIIAFEPQPNIFAALVKNKKVNDFDIRCENMALSDRSGELPFYNYGPNTFSSINTTAGSLNPDWRAERQNSIVVKSERLDGYLAQNNQGQVDLMKIDVETLEYEVLVGYGQLLFEHRPAILLEIQNETIGNRIADLLDNQRYAFFSIHEDSGLFRSKGLGSVQDHRNYLLIPEERETEVREFCQN